MLKINQDMPTLNYSDFIRVFFNNIKQYLDKVNNIKTS